MDDTARFYKRDAKLAERAVLTLRKASRRSKWRDLIKRGGETPHLKLRPGQEVPGHEHWTASPIGLPERSPVDN